MQILNRFTGSIIFEADVPTIKQCVEAAAQADQSLACASLARANLSGLKVDSLDVRFADLSNSDLSDASIYFLSATGASLSFASLMNCSFGPIYLMRANCEHVRFDGSNLSESHFAFASMQFCNFSDVKVNWGSHDLLAHMLHQKAVNREQEKIAGLILINRDCCWAQFLTMEDDPNFEWAIRTLASFARPDERIPRELAVALAKLDAEKTAKPLDFCPAGV